MRDVPVRFQPALDAVNRLAGGERYLGALVFGSVAEGTASEDSDLDVRVVVSEDNPCPNINHPLIGGVKLDITFGSLDQLRRDTTERSGQRPPMIAGAMIVFDKTGELTELVDHANSVKPPPYDHANAQLDCFLLFHADDKVVRSLGTDPESSLYSMHAGIGGVLEIHYRLRGRYTVSSKKLLSDLAEWDPELEQLVREFVTASETSSKFGLWSRIIDHVTEPFGGRQPIEENICDCERCQADLAALLT